MRNGDFKRSYIVTSAPLFPRPCYSSSCIPEFFIDRFHVQVIEWQKGLWFNPLFFHILYTILGSFLSVTDNTVHVFTQTLGDSYLVLLVTGLTEVYQSTMLEITTNNTC